MVNESLQDKIKNEVVVLASSLKDIVDKFNKLQHPIVESHEKVPQATQQLDKISDQTEAATQKMLDTIEAITEREQDVLEGLKGIVDSDINDTIKSEVNKLTEKVEANVNDAYSIMDALQFQDITSQQMDHAASLLEDIEEKLNNIIVVMDGGQEAKEPTKKKVRAYDPHADVYDKKTNQDEIDSLFKQ
ncbi:MAG: hypothetical protein DRP35_00800 [Candidatus Zixiibacteriota bacterium]|nr:MAG: hypothetical protein DRP35_00800 [candidate division Zixibacteria bacterium]